MLLAKARSMYGVLDSSNLAARERKGQSKMVTLKTNDGSFTGETEAEVIRASRKARREALKGELQDNADRQTAYRNAQATGYVVLSMLACVAAGERGSVPKGWRIKRPGEEYGPTPK